MNADPDPEKEKLLRELDEQTKSLKEYLASHPSKEGAAGSHTGQKLSTTGAPQTPPDTFLRLARSWILLPFVAYFFSIPVLGGGAFFVPIVIMNAPLGIIGYFQQISLSPTPGQGIAILVIHAVFWVLFITGLSFRRALPRACLWTIWLILVTALFMSVSGCAYRLGPDLHNGGNWRYLMSRQRVIETASAILRGELGVIEGSRILCSLRLRASSIDHDPDFLPFVAIDSETDHLPLGDVRQHWAPAALASLDQELQAAEAFHRDRAFAGCERLLLRFCPTSGDNTHHAR